MRHTHLEDLLRAQPFRPFRVVLTNGNAHEIRHPEFFMLLSGTVIIGHPETEDRFTIVDLSHIAEAETLPASAPGGTNGAAA